MLAPLLALQVLLAADAGVPVTRQDDLVDLYVQSRLHYLKDEGISGAMRLEARGERLAAANAFERYAARHHQAEVALFALFRGGMLREALGDFTGVVRNLEPFLRFYQPGVPSAFGERAAARHRLARAWAVLGEEAKALRVEKEIGAEFKSMGLGGALHLTASVYAGQAGFEQVQHFLGEVEKIRLDESGRFSAKRYREKRAALKMLAAAVDETLAFGVSAWAREAVAVRAAAFQRLVEESRALGAEEEAKALDPGFWKALLEAPRALPPPSGPELGDHVPGPPGPG